MAVFPRNYLLFVCRNISTRWFTSQYMSAILKSYGVCPFVSSCNLSLQFDVFPMFKVGKKYLLFAFAVEYCFFSISNFSFLYGITVSIYSYSKSPIRINYMGIF